MRRHSLEWIDGVPFLVLPGVHNPVVFRSGEFLAKTIPPPPDAGGSRALDMGTGSGCGAVFAALNGYRVVGIDLHDEAVRCATINVWVNRVEDRVEIRQGDLFEALRPEERFDLILFNPPFFRGQPRDGRDLAWRSLDVFERFAEGLPNAMAPGGRALVALSTDGDAQAMLKALDARGMISKTVARRHFGNEIMTVHSVHQNGDSMEGPDRR